MPTYFSCDIVDGPQGQPQMGVNAKFLDESWEKPGYLVIHATARALEKIGPQRLNVGMLLPGQSDVIDFGPLQTLWMDTNHKVFSEIANGCLSKEVLVRFTSRAIDTRNYTEFLQVISNFCGLPETYLVPNIEYIETLREHCHENFIQWAPKHYHVGVGFLLGRARERRIQRHTCWPDKVLEICLGGLGPRQIRFVDRDPALHFDIRPGTQVQVHANIISVL